MDAETRSEFGHVKEILGEIQTDQAVVVEHVKGQAKRITDLEDDMEPLKEEAIFQKKRKEQFKGVSLYLAPISTLVAIALGLVLLYHNVK